MSDTSSNALVPVRRRRGEPADPTLPAILEFLWPSTAIVNAPIPHSARGVVWIIASLVVALIAIMGLIPVDQVVTVRGVVVSKAPMMAWPARQARPSSCSRLTSWANRISRRRCTGPGRPRKPARRKAGRCLPMC